MRKLVFIAVFFTLMVVTVFSSCSEKPLILKDLVSGFLNITVTSFDNKEKLIVEFDPDTYNIYDLKFTKDERWDGQFDILYRLKFNLEDNRTIEILIIGQNAIVYDKYIYKCDEPYIDLNVFEILFSK